MDSWEWTRTRRFLTTFDLLEPASAFDAVATFEKRNPGWAVQCPVFPVKIADVFQVSVATPCWPERMIVDGRIVFRWTFLVEEK